MGAKEHELRERALVRLKKKRDFVSHLLCYLLANALCLGIWLADGGDFGNFWPIFPLAGWGVIVILHAREVFLSEPSEAEIHKEMDRLSRG